MAEQLISIEGVSKYYSEDKTSGISNINFSVAKGDFIAVVGESGSGKSTLLKTIYGLLAPDSGEIKYKGVHLDGPHEKLIPGHDSMRMLSQDLDLNLYAKVYENIESMLSREDAKVRRQKSQEMMEFLGIDRLSDKRVSDLSGGEHQRVALARAIISEPEVLLLDEPFSQLDAMLKTQFRADLKRLNEFLGITIILVSHDPMDGLTLANKMVILRNGRLIESGVPAAIYQNPSNIYTAQLLGNAFSLPKDEAEALGLKIRGSRIMIYPEWVHLKSTWSSKRYQIKGIFFKGFYEEVLLVRNDVKVIALNTSPGIYQVGQYVQVQIKKYLEFE